MTSRAAALVSALVVCVAGWSVAGHRTRFGPALITLTPEHGINAGDVAVLLLSAVGIGLLWAARR